LFRAEKDRRSAHEAAHGNDLEASDPKVRKGVDQSGSLATWQTTVRG
jgi:hypothetical protein